MGKGTATDEIIQRESEMKMQFIRGRKRCRTRWLPYGYMLLLTTIAFAYFLKCIHSDLGITSVGMREYMFRRDEIDNFTDLGNTDAPNISIGHLTKLEANSTQPPISDVTYLHTTHPTSTSHPKDRLPNCSPPAIDQFPPDAFNREQRQHGGLIVHLLVALYMFAGLAVVCDDYFVASLESISEKLNLQSDVAGATFMAAGSSAPELFTSVIGVFITHTDVGVGTIVGSAVFNLLCIVSLCGLFAGMVIKLTWWPLIRDSVFYLMSIVLLILIMFDDVVVWYEALSLLLLYSVYILIMFFNPTLSEIAIAKVKLWTHKYHKVSMEEKSPLMDTNKEVFTNVEKKADEIEMEDPSVTTCRTPYHSDGKHVDEMMALTKGAPNGSISTSADSSMNGVVIPIENTDSKTAVVKEDEEPESPLDIPDNPWKLIFWIIAIPINASLYISIPNCKTERWKNWYLVTFFMSTLWIAAFSYVMVWMVTVIGATLNIPDAVMGLTLLAAGTSVPDAMASVLVARDGYGDMAISNSIGSNIFDILLCLGLPWFIRTVSTGRAVYIYGKGLTYTASMLLITVFTLILSISLNRWKLDKKLGVIFLLIYIVFMSFAVMYELNVFGEFNLPECPSLKA